MHTPSPADIYVGKMLRGLRDVHEITQATLADSLSITHQQVQKYESGRNRISASRMFDMCKLFTVSPEVFFNMEEIWKQ